MQKILFFFFSAFILLSHVSFCQETPTATQKELQNHNYKTPDFSPPKDLSGPVFPPEELIGEPGPDTNRFLSEFLNMAATLGLLISLILIIAWFLKRMVTTRQMQGNDTSIIKIIERRSLSPKSALYLLEIEGMSLIVAESQNGVTSLAQYNSPEEDEDNKKIPSTFKKLLDKNQ